MKIIFTNHSEQRIEERNIPKKRIFYSLEENIKELRYYNNFQKVLCYRDHFLSFFFRIVNKKIIIITVLNHFANKIKKNTVVI